MQIKEPADPAAVDKGTVINWTPKALEDFADVLVARAEQVRQPFVGLDGQALKRHEKRTKTRCA